MLEGEKKMLYMELYVYDYLKKQGHTKEDYEEEIELWGESIGGNIYISELRMPGDRKPFYKPHMQYIGNFWELHDTGVERRELVYFREGELHRQEILLYTSKETEGIEHFLVYHASALHDNLQQGDTIGNLIQFPAFSHKKIPKVSHRQSLKAAEIVETEGRNKGILLHIIICVIVIFLLGNMIDALCSYESMQDVLEVLELLMK